MVYGEEYQFQSLCVSVSVFQPNGCTDLDVVFAKWLLTALARTLLKLVTLGQGHSDVVPIFFNSLLTSLLCISALLCTIKVKVGMLLRNTLVDLWSNFIKIEWVMTSL